MITAAAIDAFNFNTLYKGAMNTIPVFGPGHKWKQAPGAWLLGQFTTGHLVASPDGYGDSTNNEKKLYIKKLYKKDNPDENTNVCLLVGYYGFSVL